MKGRVGPLEVLETMGADVHTLYVIVLDDGSGEWRWARLHLHRWHWSEGDYLAHRFASRAAARRVADRFFSQVDPGTRIRIEEVDTSGREEADTPPPSTRR